MKLVVGLGNPGEKYEGNRHNVGFMFADYFIEYLHRNPDCIIKSEQNFDSISSRITLKDETYIITKPQTFMNRSGNAVAELINFYKVQPEDLCVAHDDLDIPIGKYKLQLANGPKMHNGISSIEQRIGSKDFWRIRIGVENRTPENRPSGESYVLHDFLPEERQQVEVLFKEIADKITAQR